PRRSARISTSTSQSASSSLEPEERTRPQRLTRSRPNASQLLQVRSQSDEEVVDQGGISATSVAGNRYTSAFEAAGFETLSWQKDRERLAREFAPVTQLAEDIPHDLQDRLNALPAAARAAGDMQVHIFEGEIRANTARDEPRAPPIRVVNDVDDEPTPPLEFYYSNLMWHGTEVPPPNYNELKGCGCRGPCDPNSKTCLCALRQRSLVEEHIEYPMCIGFSYEGGRLKRGREELPVVECNMNCGCSDDCPNRVVQQGRKHALAIRKTPDKGWGVFAGPQKIPAYTYLGVYAGEYLTGVAAEKREFAYNKFGRTYLFDIDFYYTGLNDYSIDAYHVGNNHSCDPNCWIVGTYINESNMEKPLLAIFTVADIEPYQELCFSYAGRLDEEDLAKEADGEASPSDLALFPFNDAIHIPCRCGAAICTGKMWK
ncbi:SET domain-containing protein, partial [Epithele typhae]|uniref:SET domain-containing protein n=1 Tax=Epithele typhae TaxID=378194 RepID=UPI002007A76F